MSVPSSPPVPKKPAVLYGALRSGTTMFRLILDHHPELHNPGETDFLLDHISRDPGHPTGWRYDREALKADRVFRAQQIDLPPEAEGCDLLEAMIAALSAKSPDSRLILVMHRNAEKLAALLPDVPVLHLLRDPRDVARSSIGMGWAGNCYYGADHWLRTEQSWDASGLASSDRTLEMRFETLMSDLPGELTRACGAMGVPFSAEMLRYPETTTYHPPDAKVAHKWRSEANPRDIALIEARAGEMMADRGYPAECPPLHLTAVQRFRLFAGHRFNRWAFNIRRYGAGLFFGQHAARLLGLRGVAAKLASRQEAVRIKHLQ